MATNFNDINTKILAHINACIERDPTAYDVLSAEEQAAFRRQRRISYLLELRHWCDEKLSDLGSRPKTKVERQCEPSESWMAIALEAAHCSEEFAHRSEEELATLKRQWALGRRAGIINEYLVNICDFLSENKLDVPMHPLWDPIQLCFDDPDETPWTPEELTVGEKRLDAIESLCLDLDTEKLHELIHSFNWIAESRSPVSRVGRAD